MAGRGFEFVQVDVFTDQQFGGNQLAVFLDGRELSDDEMQSIASEMNLAETTFIEPPEDPNNIARVRIFTTKRELPFAGHPVIGTSWVLATMGRVPEGERNITLELGIGPMPVRLEGPSNNPSFLWMDQGEAEFGDEVAARTQVAIALTLDDDDLLPDVPIQTGSTGLSQLYVPLKDRETVDRAIVNHVPLNDIDMGLEGDLTAVFFFAPEPGNRAYSRMVVNDAGNVFEDPATGSASGPLGAYLVKEGLASGGDIVEMMSEQGTKMGRQSFVHLRVENDNGEPGRIEVGGQVVPMFKGTLTIGE